MSESPLASLPPAARAALDRLWAILPHARLVGGCVRDLLAGRALNDVDLATVEAPEVVQATLEAAGIKVVPTGLAHGTVTAVIDRAPYEITTLRRDAETDGRHAVVVWTDDWREDAARRDFTINAMSLDRAGVLHDYFDGQRDLAARRVRFVGDPAARIREDALRVLRFFRFDARFGGETPDAAALAAIRAGAALVDGLSAERVAGELLRILAGPRAVRAIGSMDDAGVLRRWLPEAHLRIGLLDRLVAAGGPPDAILLLGALCDAPDLARRLRLSGAQAARLEAMRGAALPIEASDDDLRRARADWPLETLLDRLWLCQAARSGAPDAAWDGLRARLEAMPRPVFPLSGKDAVKAGIAPGPGVGVALRRVEAWWREEGCRPGRESALRRLDEVVAQG
ncbi:CCA tRNA nucleotidyltransferase [Acidomonas methanolica]|uniref:Poly(A) polymerase n=2 Tax=Acidomonas methanolica TaxID=437 RepID=A0A023D704_ACIMT|nr:CCA tRNA nucleotidyltransferase [Acidomonas methanolica]MBU2653964.1 CCA tRNA nucleotidyltransferase [Acidomonas methanolica]TCS30925.1 poly(A) polymerase [Acidomonas methanolica]GAJ29947.1 poly(A) polymerase [Acidomonas methanolica NBRC 104435]GEK98278.1 polynucleotide adenylyltransferase [Acidomonas methanolica NBRC 104435]